MWTCSDHQPQYWITYQRRRKMLPQREAPLCAWYKGRTFSHCKDFQKANAYTHTCTYKSSLNNSHHVLWPQQNTQTRDGALDPPLPMPLHMHEALGKCHWHNNNAIHMKVRTCIHILHTHVGTSIGGFGGQWRMHRYIDRYIQLDVSCITSMWLAHARPNKPCSDTHKICISTYVHTTYVHTCVATTPHYFSIHTRTHNIADTILTTDVEDLHTCSTPHSLLLLHHHQSHWSQDWAEETTHNTTNKTVWLLRHILQVFTSHDTHYERKCM